MNSLELTNQAVSVKIKDSGDLILIKTYILEFQDCIFDELVKFHSNDLIKQNIAGNKKIEEILYKIKQSVKKAYPEEIKNQEKLVTDKKIRSFFRSSNPNKVHNKIRTLNQILKFRNNLDYKIPKNCEDFFLQTLTLFNLSHDIIIDLDLLEGAFINKAENTYKEQELNLLHKMKNSVKKRTLGMIVKGTLILGGLSQTAFSNGYTAPDIPGGYYDSDCKAPKSFSSKKQNSNSQKKFHDIKKIISEFEANLKNPEAKKIYEKVTQDDLSKEIIFVKKYQSIKFLKDKESFEKAISAAYMMKKKIKISDLKIKIKIYMNTYNLKFNDVFLKIANNNNLLN